MFSQALRTLCFISLCFTGSIQAMELEYAGFYQYLKGADDVAYNRVRPAFHLIKSDRRGDACAIKQAQIRVLAGANPLDVDEQFPLTYDPSTGEFFVPYDKRLKDKRASLWFDVPELCVLKMAVIGKLEGKDFDSNNNYTYTNTRGVAVNGQLGEQLSFSTSIYESQGLFADYYNNYSNSLKPSGGNPAIVPGIGIALTSPFATPFISERVYVQYS